jgi:hypothetical protein
MIALIGILFTVVVIAVAMVMLGLRRWVLEEGRTEALLRDPATHTVTYLIPNGQDPASLMGALAHAHFTAVIDSHGGSERLLVACEETDRPQVRLVIAEVNQAGSGRTWMPDVRFEDEPASAAS